MKTLRNAKCHDCGFYYLSTVSNHACRTTIIGGVPKRNARALTSCDEAKTCPVFIRKQYMRGRELFPE